MCVHQNNALAWRNYSFSIGGPLPAAPHSTRNNTSPRENCLFCIKLLSVVYQSLMFYFTKTRQTVFTHVNFSVVSVAFNSLEFQREIQSSAIKTEAILLHSGCVSFSLQCLAEHCDQTLTHTRCTHSHDSLLAACQLSVTAPYNE